MTYRIAVAIVNTSTIKSVSPGSYGTAEQAKAEIMYRNRQFPLAPRLERVVIEEAN